MEQKIEILRTARRQEQAGERTIRVAIYARYSSIGNSPYSAEEQVQRIRYHVNRGAIRSRRYPDASVSILEEWVIKDEAKTGRVTREGYELIKAGIASKKFDMLLMDDISRMTRDMGATIDLYESLVFGDIEGYSLSDQISTLDSNAKDLFIFKGYANEHQSAATSKNTMRGLELRVLGGFSTGHYPYGYYTVPTRSTVMKGVEKPSHYEIRIDNEKARVVEEIWKRFAEGVGCRSIANELNRAKIPGPSRNRSVVNRWGEKSVWNVLNQDKYIGVWTYRKTRVVKNPQLDKLVLKPRAEEEWLVWRREDLRIIPAEIEAKVRERRAEISHQKNNATTKEQKLFSGRNKVPTHLFVGTLTCSLCGGNMLVMSGKAGGYMGCFNAHRQTLAVCKNRQLIRNAWIDWHLIEVLRVRVDNEDTYAYLAKRYNEITLQRQGDLPRRLAKLEEQLVDVERAVTNFEKFIRQGYLSERIAQSLAEAELSFKLLKAEREHVRAQIDNRVYITPAAVKERMIRISEILGKRIFEANQVLRRIFQGKILMTPVQDGRQKYYRAEGAINLYGVMRFNLAAVGGPLVQLSEPLVLPFSCEIRPLPKNVVLNYENPNNDK